MAKRIIILCVALCAVILTWTGKSRGKELKTAAIQDQSRSEAVRVALTFDDGPHKIYTKDLLDGLKQRDVKASFFLMGKNIRGNEDLVKRMHEEGHLIGNHTFDHVQLNKLSDTSACEQIHKTSNAIYEITGEYTCFLRPPFGEWKEDLDCAVTMMPVLWTVDPDDWMTKDADLIVRRVESVVEDEDIILMHDNYASSVEAALRIVDDLKARGYEFVTVDKLLIE